MWKVSKHLTKLQANGEGLTFWATIYSISVTSFRARMCLLGWQWNYVLFSGSNCPKTQFFRAWIDLFKLNVWNIKTPINYGNDCTDCSHIIHSDKDQQVLFVGGLNTRRRDDRHIETRSSAVAEDRATLKCVTVILWTAFFMRLKLLCAIWMCDVACYVRRTDGCIGPVNCPVSVHRQGAISWPGAPSVMNLMDNT